MIVFVFGLFACIILILAVYLLRHRHNLFGLSAEKLGLVPSIYGSLLLLTALAILVSSAIYRDAPLPTTLFVIVGTLLTTAMAVSISQRMFK
ncbi:hypothetical protein WOSG25_031320 [Weissella oryzae SG25]|uniref:Uncharacterized protein n=1 Tax=Weissella oryzae (strain DSM 25784 / JCM 18191 / LMG 30913 / SG25) TaxID=1329250 RepID=A0A069CRW1_WEIOS|nr:hypothetical protein [Weissella oryzae]GAK30535.1 hypothetical protein WOSG25_031320 [Weissella oryzae SG25]